MCAVLMIRNQKELMWIFRLTNINLDRTRKLVYGGLLELRGRVGV